MTVIRVSGPICPHCHRPLLVQNGKCLCCGKEAKDENCTHH
jgi:hypothetical protein